MTRRQARREAYKHAVRSGNRAYNFRDARGGKEEVRVWPDGTVTYTAVNDRGVPTAGPRKAWTREGGLKTNLRRPTFSPAWLAVAGLIIERLI